MQEQTVDKNEMIGANDLLGLFLIDPETGDKYIHAFSVSREILEKMLAEDVIEQEKKYFHIENVKIISIHKMIKVLYSDSNSRYKIKMHGKSKSIFTTSVLNLSKKSLKENKLFGFNGFKYNGSQMLAYIMHDSPSDSVEYENYVAEIKEDLKDEPEMPIFSIGMVEFDTFYDESVMNA